MSNLNVLNLIKNAGIVIDDFVVEQGEKYIRFNKGKQICWDTYTANDYTYRTLPIPFINNDYIVIKGFRDSTSTSQTPIRIFSCNNRSTTQFETYDVTRAPIGYLAIGKWK